MQEEKKSCAMLIQFIWMMSLSRLSIAKRLISMEGEVHISQEEQAQAVLNTRIQCLNHILYDPYPKGLYCNRTFDGLACWPDTEPGTIAYQPCPNYVQGFYPAENATRRCMPDGTWYESPLFNDTWSNYSLCMKIKSPTQVSQLMTVHVEYIQLLYNTGYGISLVSLVLAVFIMIHFRKLHCPRNTVHINLFISFIFRAILSFLKDILMVQGLGFSFDVEQASLDSVIFINKGSHWECKLLHTLFLYALSANYMWILIEGLYLHTLVYVSVFSERSSVRWYYVLGWGTPFLSIIPWVIVRATLENIYCWNTNPTPGYFWILKTPIVISLMINFIFFINILRALFTKLHKPSTTSARRNRYRRLAKSTLILIPLFGVHYIVFIGVPDNVEPTAEVVKLYFEMFFNSFQGFLVAVLFCFLNHEVQMEIKKKWHRCWSKPDPAYLQQSQYLADSQNSNHDVRRMRNGSRAVLQNGGRVSSESSSARATCLCKWTLDKNGRLRRSFVKSSNVKTIMKDTKL